MTTALLIVLIVVAALNVALELRGAVRRRRARRWPLVIGGKRYRRVQPTLPVMASVLLAIPETDDLDAGFSRTRSLEQIESLYGIAAMLLEDEEGEHPDPEELGEALSMPAAARFVEQTLDSTKGR